MFEFFKKNDTKIAGGILRPLRKTPMDIRMERIDLNHKIYGLKSNNEVQPVNNSADNSELLAAKRDINNNL